MELSEKRQLQAFATKIRIAALDCVSTVGSGHLGGTMSMADTCAVLYGREMKIDPKNPTWEERDKLVTSKGHCGPAMYATLALKGFFPYEWLHTLNQPHTNLPSHTDRNKTPGIDATTGSLGQGTSLAVGLALGDRLKGINARTFLFVGDGESNEGQVWEAMSFAAAKKLSNLVVMLDWNKKQLDGLTTDVNDMGDFVAKFKAFGFETMKVNGNDVEEVAAALEATRKGGDKPYAIVLDTVKGFGVTEMAEMKMNHSVALNKEAKERWTAELEARLAELEG